MELSRHFFRFAAAIAGVLAALSPTLGQTQTTCEITPVLGQEHTDVVFVVDAALPG